MRIWPFMLALPVVLAAGGAAWLYRSDLPAAEIEARYAQPGSRFVEVGGLRVHVVDEGAGQGPPLLLLPGFTSSHLVYGAWAKRLRARWRVLRVDLPGQGLTGPDPEGRYAWEAQAKLVVGVLDALGVERAHIVGNSAGGAVAWHLAALAPERVRTLTLIAPVGYPFEGRLPWVFRLLTNPVLGRLAVRLTPESAFVDRLAATYGDVAKLDPALAHGQYELFRRAGNRGAILAQLGGGPGGTVPDPRPFFARITARVLLLWGTADRLTPPGMAARFQADIKGARLVTVEGAGHSPQAERPDETVALLEPFWRDAVVGGTLSPVPPPPAP